MRYCLRGTKRFLLTKIYFLCLGLYFPYRSAQKKLRHNSNGWNCVTGKECNQMGRKTFQFCVKPHWNVYDYQSKKWFYAELFYLYSIQIIRKQLSIIIILYIVPHFYGLILMLIPCKIFFTIVYLVFSLDVYVFTSAWLEMYNLISKKDLVFYSRYIIFAYFP